MKRILIGGTITALAIPAFSLAQLLGGGLTGSVTGAARATTSVGSTVGEAGSATRVGAGSQSALEVTKNAALTSRLGPMLPSGGSMSGAAAGFQNESDFVTTLHAAHNLNIPFEQLKAQTTGKGSVSLDAAIRKLRPELDGKAVKDNVSLAEHQADRDIRQSETSGSRDKVAARIVSDSQLAARLNPLVPEGQDLSQAAAGFRDEEQFLATLHAAHDNDVAFADLKDRVTAGQSLSAALHDMKPSMSADASASAAANAGAAAKRDRVETSTSASASANAKVQTK